MSDELKALKDMGDDELRAELERLTEARSKITSSNCERTDLDGHIQAIVDEMTRRRDKKSD